MGAKGAALMLPFANTAAMQMHLDEISCNVALETYFPKSKSSRTSPGTVQEPCLERRRPINIWCDRKQRDKPFR